MIEKLKKHEKKEQIEKIQSEIKKFR